MALCIDCEWRQAAKERKICHCCRIERYKKKYPVKYAFQVLRQNARRRGVVFGLTLADFEKFCIKTNYINGKGKTNTGLHIDRIDERKGYFKGNIQALPNAENVKKYIQFDYEERQRGLGSGFRYIKQINTKTGTDDDPDMPF